MPTKSKTQTIKVKVNEENPEPMEVIAKSIIDVADAFQKLRGSRLKERVIVLLIKDCCSVGINDIEKVLDAASKLKDVYIKKPVSK
jgi:hypothetical protein